MGGALFLSNCWNQQFMDHSTRGNYNWYGQPQFGKKVTILATPPEVYVMNNNISIEENVRSSNVAIGNLNIYQNNQLPKSILRKVN